MIADIPQEFSIVAQDCNGIRACGGKREQFLYRHVGSARLEFSVHHLINPVSSILDELLKGIDYKTITTFLDPIIRIRAVQNFSPSQATGFIFFLKNVIRENLLKEISEEQIINELLLFESKIDELSLIAFNLYMQCREKIYELKANGMKNRTFRAFERAGLVKEIPAVEPDLKHIINTTKEASNDI